jgi:adenine phosphoribosyltransferase
MEQTEEGLLEVAITYLNMASAAEAEHGLEASAEVVEELLEKAKALLEKCPEHDVVVTAESKGIPLAYEMARIGCRKYVVARKGVKAYMIDPVCVEVKSITTANVQKLYLSQDDREAIEGKRVLIVDDVVSTGESLIAIEKLVDAFGGNIVGRACVLAEGDAKDRTDIIYLEPLPLFFK